MAAYDYERTMTNHPLATDADVKNVERLRIVFKTVASDIDMACPDSREKSLAFTNLEQALQWAIASIARDGH